MPRALLTLLVLRHAEAAPQGDEPGDRARPLTKRGRHQADAMARHLVDEGPAPDVVLCSPALRTRQTADALVDAGLRAEVRIVEALYHGGTADYLREARACEAPCVLIVAHNPTCAAIAAEFEGGGGSSAFTPASLLVAEWANGTGRIVRRVAPDRLEA